MTPNLPVDRLFDERAAANVLSCSVALLRKWRLFDEGPAYCKIGRLVRYRQSDIDAFLDSHRVATGGGEMSVPGCNYPPSAGCCVARPRGPLPRYRLALHRSTRRISPW